MKKFAKIAALAGVSVMMLSSTALAGDTFKIGTIGPLTGAGAAYGNAVMNGAQIAVDEINEAGGINGAQVEFKAEDDQLDEEKAVTAYNSLKDWDMQILLGTVTSGSCLAVSTEAAPDADNIFMLTPSGSQKDCIAAGDNEFRVCFSDPDQGSASAIYIGEHGLAEKVGVIYNSSIDYSKGIYATFRQEAEEQPFEIVAAEAFTNGSVDFSAQLQSLKDAGAELVYLPFYYDEIAVVLKQAKDMDFAPIWFGVDGMDGLLTVEGFDQSLAEGCILLTPFSADAEDELTVNFVTKYQELYGEVPNQFAADAYDGMYILKAAIEKAGATPDMSASEISDIVKVAMTEISVDGLTGTGMTWNAEGEPSKSPKTVQIQNGVYVGME